MQPVDRRNRFLMIAVAVVCVIDASHQFAAAQSGDTAAAEILKRAIEAAGGQKTLEKLKRPTMWMEKGTFYGMGEGVPFIAQYASRWPDWFRQEIEGAFVITVNGESAWVSSAAGLRKLTEVELVEQLKQTRVAWAARLFPLTDDDYTLSVIEGVEVEGRPTFGLNASHADQRDVQFFFDRETHLLVRIETMVISPQFGADRVLSETVFTEHKSFSGAKLPSRMTVHYDGKLFFESETVDYKTGATLDPSHFDAPK